MRRLEGLLLEALLEWRSGELLSLQRVVAKVLLLERLLEVLLLLLEGLLREGRWTRAALVEAEQWDGRQDLHGGLVLVGGRRLGPGALGDGGERSRAGGAGRAGGSRGEQGGGLAAVGVGAVGGGPHVLSRVEQREHRLWGGGQALRERGV